MFLFLYTTWNWEEKGIFVRLKCNAGETCSGVVWCGVVSCGVVWCGVVWCPCVPGCLPAVVKSKTGFRLLGIKVRFFLNETQMQD